MRQAEIYCNHILAGVLTESDSGSFLFKYVDSYLNDSKNTAISMSFPLKDQTFTSEVLFPFFYNMLSEGANRTMQCSTLRIDESDDFSLLLATAHTDTIGAIKVKAI